MFANHGASVDKGNAREAEGAASVQRALHSSVPTAEGSGAGKPTVLRGPAFCGAAGEELSEKPLAFLLTHPD